MKTRLTRREEDVLGETRYEMPAQAQLAHHFRRGLTYHGSKARILERMNTPYVEMRETTIRAKIGVPKFFTAWIAQSTAQRSMLSVISMIIPPVWGITN